jgi:hypothetical protein
MRRAALLVLLAIGAAGCGGSNDSGGTPYGGASQSKLVASVSSAKVDENGSAIKASVKVKTGGVAGRKLTLEYGLVDALLGTESETERVVHRYVTTVKVTEDEQSVTVPKKQVNSPLLVHFVLYGPDGRYLASADTKEFGPGT